MNKHGNSLAALPLLRRFPRTVLLFVSLAAVIVGILAMHVWMDGHGATHAVGPAVTAPSASDVHHQELTPVSTSDIAAAGMTLNLNCADTCGAEIAAAGVCILAFLVVSLAAAITLRSRLVYGRISLRGPPPALQLPRTFVPSLTLVQLCISRT